MAQPLTCLKCIIFQSLKARCRLSLQPFRFWETVTKHAFQPYVPWNRSPGITSSPPHTSLPLSEEPRLVSMMEAEAKVCQASRGLTQNGPATTSILGFGQSWSQGVEKCILIPEKNSKVTWQSARREKIGRREELGP